MVSSRVFAFSAMRSIGAYFIVSPSGLNVAASEATDVKLVRDSGSASQWDVFRRVDGRLLFRNVATRAWLCARFSNFAAVASHVASQKAFAATAPATRGSPCVA